MPCKDFKNAIVEAAANAAGPQGKLRAHLSVCADCRGAFAAEIYLFSSLDAAVQSIARTDVPPTFLRRVRARLAEETSPRFGWINWTFIGATAVAAIAGLLFLRVDTRGVKSGIHVVSGPVANRAWSSQRTSSPHREPPKPENPGVERGPNAVEAELHVPRLVEPMVVVPSEQRQAMALVIAAARRGEMPEYSLIAKEQESDVEPQPAGLAPLEITAINIPALNRQSVDRR
jgi:hypothetical protein